MTIVGFANQEAARAAVLAFAASVEAAGLNEIGVTARLADDLARQLRACASQEDVMRELRCAAGTAYICSTLAGGLRAAPGTAANVEFTPSVARLAAADHPLRQEYTRLIARLGERLLSSACATWKA